MAEPAPDLTLLDRLKASAPARIVSLASKAHQGQRLDFDNLQLERGWRPISQPLTRAFAGTPEQGAETPLYLAASPEVEGVTGTYFIRCKPTRSTDFSYDEAAARRLWDESDRLTRL